MLHYRLLIGILLNTCLCFASSYGQDPLSGGEHFAPVNGITMHYDVEGKGPVCLLPSPGWGPSVELYQRSFKPFEKYFTMVYYDTGNSGKSTGPDDPAKYTTKDFMNDMDALRIHLKQEKIWVMGHSAGGYQVLNYGILHNDHLHGIIAIDGDAGTDSLRKAQFRALIMKRQGQPYFEKGAKLLLSDTASYNKEEMFVIIPFYFHDPRYLDSLMKFGKPQISAKANKYTNISHFESAYLFPDLGKITVPTLLVVGDDDFICDKISQADRISKRINSSNEIVIKDAGHFPWVEQPDIFFPECITWLKDQGVKENK